MKLHLSFLFGVGLSLAVGSANAQKKADIFYYDELFQNGEFILASGFNKVSSNGEYAVGSDNMLSGKAFMWTNTTGEISFLNDEAGGEYQYAYDVANDGTVVGVFYFPDKKLTVTGYDGSDMVIEGCYLPSLLKDGELTELKLPDGVSLVNVGSSDYGPQAVAISSDGRYVAGYGFYPEKGQNYPILWKDGEPQEFLDFELAGQGFIVNDLSEDGTLIVGLAETERGDRIPAVIENGKLKILFETSLDDEVFYEGLCWRVDEEKNVTGYMMASDMSYFGFVYNEKDGLVELNSEFGIITRSRGSNFLFGMDAITYGNATVVENGEMKLLKDYLNLESDKFFSNVMDCSSDGNVLVGNGMIYNEMGALNCPFVIVLKDEGSSISQVSDADTNATLDEEGILHVSGEYTGVQIYDAFGALLIEGSSKHNTYDLSDVAAGVYVVRVNGVSGTNVFKFVKR